MGVISVSFCNTAETHAISISVASWEKLKPTCNPVTTVVRPRVLKLGEKRAGKSKKSAKTSTNSRHHQQAISGLTINRRHVSGVQHRDFGRPRNKRGLTISSSNRNHV